MRRVAVWVDGIVQGVGFRWWGQTVARELGLTGTIRNLADGRVEVHAQGDEASVGRFVHWLTATEPGLRRPGRIDDLRNRGRGRPPPANGPSTCAEERPSR